MTIDPMTIVAVNVCPKKITQNKTPQKAYVTFRDIPIAQPTIEFALYQQTKETAALKPDKTSHKIGIPAVKVPPNKFIPPTRGTISTRTTKPEINSLRFTATSVSIMAPPKLENTPSSPQQIAAINAQMIPNVKFGAPSGFTKLMMMAPTTHKTIPKTTRFVGRCFKNIQANNAPKDYRLLKSESRKLQPLLDQSNMRRLLLVPQ